MAAARPHVLGIDDGPFEKRQSAAVPVVAAMMEGALLLESVATSAFPVDGEHATDFLADWVGGLRCHPTLQAVILGGITLAGLGVVDVQALAQRIARPVLIVNRRDPDTSRVRNALASAGLAERIGLVDSTPVAARVRDGLYLSFAGTSEAEARRLLAATCGKALLPEPLRVAHLIARAIVRGESRGRV